MPVYEYDPNDPAYLDRQLARIAEILSQQPPLSHQPTTDDPGDGYRGRQFCPLSFLDGDPALFDAPKNPAPPSK